ncbi:MarR family winged helix-turn-helix transcriptional regulator [Jiella sonneratiae]|uniref:Winged helix-turn-helix transcriptional regulator n=1 Tax=Jiella sonneratiae TaxID=2816856 RepID=A0ABS3J956_9HYPH|nr:MarR family winged helix-turn-helix transcriptional regulator [Jiella sonneratiae]MBO0906208.1 winged helix-turn-helix transcriptional regulator [Jiella sonneratiae]
MSNGFDSRRGGGDVPFATTLHVRDRCLCLHAQRAARAIARRFDEVFRPLDLKSGQFSLLMALNRPEPPTLGPVADLLGMDRTTLTANLKPLERRGLIEVRRDAADRRSRRLVLTGAGRALLAEAVPLWERTQAELEGALRPFDDPDRLRAGLDALR